MRADESPETYPAHEALPEVPPTRQWLRVWGPKLIGLVLLVLLVGQVDLGRVAAVLRTANPLWITAAVLGNLPLTFVKAMRWQRVLAAQSINMPVMSAFLAYFGSLFIGLLTPGRLGEFVKALHVSRDCGASSAHAFSSVLADRLFDLYTLLLVGSAALLTLTAESQEVVLLTGIVLLVTLPIVLLVNTTTFGWMQKASSRLSTVGQRFLAEDGWLQQMRSGLRRLSTAHVLLAAVLTVIAYLIYFSQCYVLAQAIGLPLSFASASFAASLGSLVTLLPVSVAGLGTREAAVVSYLGAFGISAEVALGFSLLMFFTFFMMGGVFGAVAWWLKPVTLGALRKASN